MTFTKAHLALAFLGLVLIATLFPVSLPLGYIPYSDKICHILASGSVALVLSQFLSIRKSVLISFLLFTTFELLQIYIPNRSASIGDGLANTIGVLVAWFLYSKTNLISKLNSCIMPRN